VTAGLLALLLGCPARRPPEPELPAEPPITPVLVRDFAELGPDQYAELRTEPPRTSVPLDVVTGRHDVARWTSTRTVWGRLAVLEFRDTDHPHTALQPTAGWYLGDRRRDGRETVAAALVRDFGGAPVATDPQQLMLDLAEAWPPPWTFCQPGDADRAGELVVHDPARGVRLGLLSSASDDGTVSWTIDHVEYVATGLPLATWLDTKGYGGCAELGTLIEGGKYRPARRTGD